MDERPGTTIGRRAALGVLGGLGGVALASCSGGSTPAAAESTATASPTPATGVGADATPTALLTATSTPNAAPTANETVVPATASPSGAPTASSTTASSSDCVTTNEGEIGPYFADDSASGFDRSNILSNVDGTSTQSGIPLTLNLYVIDTESSGCGAYVGAQIDIWHCNASGVYSDISSEDTSAETWLRGYQITDSNGYVRFETIVPGWYSGRTTHIHLRIRSTYNDASSTSDGSNTTQLFFDQSTIDTIDTTIAPYDSEGKNPTTNAGDHVYAGEVDGQTLVTLSGSSSEGYTTTFTIGLPIGGKSSTSARLRRTVERIRRTG